MSTLREIGIDFAQITEVGEKVDEKVITPADDLYEEDVEFTVTLTLKVFTRRDVETLQQMVTDPYTGHVAMYSSR